MIVDLCFLQLKPRCVPDFEAALGQALGEQRTPNLLRGCWRTEVGDIDSMVQLWSTESVGGTAPSRPAVRDELLMEQDVMSVELAPFSPPIEPRALGAIYELRIYAYEAGCIPTVIERWQEKIDARMKLSPLVLCGHSVNGRLHRWVHLWAYENAVERQRIRAESLRQKIWPPDARAGLIRQRNMLLIPSALSPLH
jgi:hypothetical protein